MAPPFVACRICYKVEGKVKNYKDDEFYIQAYEDLSGCPFDDVLYITKFCPICACVLKKLYSFRKYCRTNYESLTNYLNTGRKMTKPYLYSMDFIREWHPIKLTTWKATTVLDCVHSPKKYKHKLKLDQDICITHMAVPKDEAAEIPYTKEIPNKNKQSRYYVGDYFWDPPDDFVDNDEECPEVVEIEVPSVVDVVNAVKTEEVSEESILDEPTVEIDRDNAIDQPNGATDKAVHAIAQSNRTDRNATDLGDDATEREVKLEQDPDNLTLQEIKAELQAGVEMGVQFSVEKEKRRKGTKRKVSEKDPKPTKNTQRKLLQAKRQKSNQELAEHFGITSFLSEEEQRGEFLKRRESEAYLEGRYKCELCLKSFKEQKWMDTHLKKHEPPAGSYICGICKIRCRTQKLFRTHRDANHTTKYSCKRCDYITYSKAQALKHHSWHEGVEHTCQHCGATFRKYTTYMGHLRRAHPSSYICGACACSFVSAYGLHLHTKAVHKDISKIEDDGMKCEECEVTFVSHKMYIRHILITDKHKEMSKDILGCRKCGEQFESRELMEKHTHYKERKYVRRDAPKRNIKCDECDEVFSHPNGVYQHYLREHPDKPYQFAIQRHYLCEQCGKTFKSPGLLQQHCLIHKGLRPPAAKKPAGRNTCRTCGKTYSKLSGLFRHKLTHLGVRRHKCHICEKAFTDTSNLKQHVQGVHLNIRRVRKR